MFRERRQHVLEAMGPDAIGLFVGARLKSRSNDTHYGFRQDSDFWYLTGFDHPDAVAVLRTDGGPAFTLFVQPREPEAETWNGYRPGVEGAVRDFGADEAHPIGELHTRLPRILEKARRIFHVLGRDAQLDRRLVEALEELRLRSRIGVDPASEIVDPRSIVHEMRLFKSEEELSIMRLAQDITLEAHREAAALARPGCMEFELEAALDCVFRRRGGAGAAYNTIVGGGVNATVLHYVRNDQPLRDRDLVLIDAGAEVQGYAADITRTYPIGGRFEGGRRAVYEAVLDAQLVGPDASRPGATLESIHDATTRRLVEHMVELRLLKGNADDLIREGAHRRYYMHRTSHWLGLDVHDVGAYTRNGKPRLLEPGIVFTVEPGLYVSPSDGEAPESLRGIGVRIEDDVLVTRDGHENLSAAFPKRLDEIEAWVGAR